MIEVGDIGEVVDGDKDQTEEIASKVVEGEIIDVSKYCSCSVCGGKVNDINTVLGQCTKCRAKVKLSRSKKCTTAKFVVEDDIGNHFTLTAYNQDYRR